MSLRKRFGFLLTWGLLLILVCGAPAWAAKSIILGCPLSMAFLYGWDAGRGVNLAVAEINAQGEST